MKKQELRTVGAVYIYISRLLEKNNSKIKKKRR